MVNGLKSANGDDQIPLWIIIIYLNAKKLIKDKSLNDLEQVNEWISADGNEGSNGKLKSLIGIFRLNLKKN